MNLVLNYNEILKVSTKFVIGFDFIDLKRKKKWVKLLNFIDFVSLSRWATIFICSSIPPSFISQIYWDFLNCVQVTHSLKFQRLIDFHTKFNPFILNKNVLLNQSVVYLRSSLRFLSCNKELIALQIPFLDVVLLSKVKRSSVCLFLT